MTGLLLVLILGLSVGFGLLLVALVQREGPRERGLGWDAAERVARRDGAGDERDSTRYDRDP